MEFREKTKIERKNESGEDSENAQVTFYSNDLLHKMRRNCRQQITMDSCNIVCVDVKYP